MPAGCDFVCKFDKCEHVNKGFTITDIWPMAEIDELLSTNLSEDTKAMYWGMKNDNHTHGCLVLPNKNNIRVSAYRVQLWSSEAKCIWNYKIDAIRNTSEIITKNLPDKCPKTNCNLQSFKEVIENGIKCPFCNNKMSQLRWVSNDK